MRRRFDRLLGPLPPWLAAVLAVLVAGIAVSIAVTVDDDGKVHGTVTIDIRTPVGVQHVEADRDNELDADERADAKHGTQAPPLAPGDNPLTPVLPVPVDPDAAVVAPDVHEDMRDESPGKPGIENAPPAAEQVAPGVGEPQKLGGAQSYSCPAAYVQNQSALTTRRSGVALHFTVSSPGSLLAIRGLFNTPSFGASSNYGIELAGRCQTWVPPGRKAWAQGAFNSAYESIEIVTYDLTRAQWLATPIVRDGILAGLVRDRLRANGAPLKLVDPVGCTPKAGVTDHDRLECGNTHWDVGDHFPWDVFMRQVRTGDIKPVSKRQRERCQRLNRLRRKAKPKGPQLSAAERAEWKRIKAGLKRYKLKCRYGPPGSVVRR